MAAAVAACLLAALLSPSSRAEAPTPPATQKGFSFCTVHDTAGRTIWASPVFEYDYSSGPGGNRDAEMASDFHALIGSMGGAGDKSCSVTHADRATVEGWRDEQRGILTARFMGIVRSTTWRDVAWTPKAWTPALLARPAAVTRYFYCYGTDTDQGNLRASSVASPVFEASVDGADPMAAHALAARYGEQFARYVVDVHGLAQANPSCVFKDTRAEADKALRDYRKVFSGFNMAFADAGWRPAGAAAIPRAASLPPPSAPVDQATPAPASADRKYCYAFIHLVGKPGGVRSHVWENDPADGSQAAMVATLAGFIAHMREQQPDRWQDFTASPVGCDVARGFCYASAFRGSRVSKIAGQFCKAKREEAEADWTRLPTEDQDLQTIAWPAAR